MAPVAVLTASRSLRHHEEVEDVEATQLMLVALFDIRAAVYEIHDEVVWKDEDDDAEEEEEDA